ncbi:MAG: FtsX-like permease family protein, partial [Gammaproteobacteria bacterium]|nr:FtsX-like permease family protein [Gammaproteobacteria bacterium]
SMMRQISSAFSLNLSMLSLLALVVGAFLIYNTMTFAVVRRRTMLGTLRTLGVTREELFHLILWEALLVGAAGTLFGIMLGIVMADGFLGLITRTINDLYYVLTVREVTISSPALFKAAVLGLGTAVAAACIPAWEAASVSPRIAMQRSRIESRARYLVPRAATAGVLVLGAGGLVLLIPGDSLFLGFAGLFGVILGFTLLAPGVMVITVRLLNPLIRVAGSYLGAMSARGLTSSLSRTAVAVAALMVAVSATVGVGIMVDSFRQTVDRWLKYRLQADIYVTAPGVATNR